MKRALANSSQLEEKFESRTDRRFKRMFQNGPPIFRIEGRDSNDTGVGDEQNVGRYSEENGTRGGYPMKIPPIGWWE